MAGLDTRGLASGFAQGFGLMNQYQQQQFQNERAEKQDAMQAEQFDMQKQQFSAQQEDVQRQRDMEEIQFTLGKIGSGMDVAEDELETLRRYPKFWAALDPQTDASINQAMAVIDPDTTVDANDPESLEALNQMFGAEINRGDGGQKRVVGMYPGTDGHSVMLELEVVGEDGNIYRAPMTEGRGTAEDDLIKAVPIEALVEQVQGMRLLRNTMRTPEAQQRATQVLSLLRGDSKERWEQVQGPGGSLLQRNMDTGKLESVVGRAPQSGGNYWDRPTATQKDIEYLVSNGLAPSREAAWQMLNRSNDSSRDELKYYTGRLEDIESILSAPGAANTMSDEELAQFQGERQAIRDMLPELESRAFGRQPAGLSIPASRQSSTTASSSADQPSQPERERGLRPGPAPGEETDEDPAAAILNKYF
ncbi:hypothetical protein HaloA020_29340 [Halomonas sp. A020]|uniref:hypothetical protein n=1 Tax=Halomonas sp. A020 TaxID=2717374 RepID=UPI00249209E4|nr:hypothetical protein [Halomonas sp. A020]BCB62233.1 hypothetical protein HaloA020_29340 [Halomonas sp. A020]